MKTYELTYIVSPDITSEEVEAKAKEIESIISSKEGTILKQSNPVAKTLAYPIEKRASGFFGILEFQLEPEQLLELKEILLKDSKIVRHMILIKEPVRIRKERRTRIKPGSEEAQNLDTEDLTMQSVKPVEIEVEKETEVEAEEEKDEKPTKVAEKEKVELKDIEQKLDELLGE